MSPDIICLLKVVAITARTARELSIDYAEAIVAFDFTQGQNRAVPIKVCSRGKFQSQYR